MSNTVGADGVEGCTFTVAAVTAETHPEALRAVTLYDPAEIPLKIPVVFV